MPVASRLHQDTSTGAVIQHAPFRHSSGRCCEAGLTEGGGGFIPLGIWNDAHYFRITFDGLQDNGSVTNVLQPQCQIIRIQAYSIEAT